MSQLSFEIEALLYRKGPNYDELANILSQLLCSSIRDFKVSILLYEGNLIENLLSIKSTEFYTFEKFLVNKDVLSGSIRGLSKKWSNEFIKGDFYLLKHPKYEKIWLLLTDGSRKFIEKPLKKFFKAIWPRVTSPILTTKQIENILVELQKNKVNTEIRIKQIGQRGRIRSKGAFRQIESDRKWTDLRINEAFNEIKETGQWVTDVTCEFITSNKLMSEFKIGRYGNISFKNDLDLSFYSVIDMASQYTQERYSFLKGRDKTAKTGFVSKPFSIDFGYSALNSKEQIGRLGLILKNIPSTTCTVLHGNPYYRSVIVDYSDASVYELLVINHDKITVIPQGRTTVRALQRLCSYIFSDFREGELKEIVYG